MYGLHDWQFWAQALWFLVAISISWYIPGSVILRRFRCKPAQHYLLAFSLGLVLWGFQAYILGYGQVRTLSYVYLLAFAVLLAPHWLEEKQRWLELISNLHQRHLVIATVIALGSCLQLIQVFPTGLTYQDTIGFFGVNAYDGVLHLAFIQALADHFPAQQPGAVGLALSNYHYWSDLIAADLHRVWQLSVSHIFFQFMPVILAVGTGLAVWQVVRAWKGTTSTVIWCLIALYFSGDVAYVFTLLLHGHWGADVAAIDNGATQLLNIPHSYAKFIFLAALIPLSEWFKQKSLAWGTITVLFMASLVGLKVYFGMFSVLGLGLVGIALVSQAFISSRLDPTQIWPRLISLRWFVLPMIFLGIAGAAIFLPANRHSGGLLWAPLEWPKLFLGADHINWPDWWLRKQVYDAAGNVRAIIFMDSLAIGICLLSIFGVRLLGMLPSSTWYRRVRWEVTLFLIPTSFIFMFLGLYTLQVSGLFNVFNFFAVATVPLALATGFWFDWLWRKPAVFKILPVILIMIGLPRIVLASQRMLQAELSLNFERAISPAQQAAFTYLRTQTEPNAVIQSHPRNEFDRKTPYLAFFSHRSTFLTGISMLESHNQPIADRRLTLENIFAQTDEAAFYQGLTARQIKYIYVENDREQQVPVTFPSQLFSVVFENEDAQIIKLN